MTIQRFECEMNSGMWVILRRSFFQRFSTALVLLPLALTADVTNATAILSWQALTGGIFSNPSNWNPSQVPTLNDRVKFKQSSLAGYTVSFTGNAVSRNVEVHNDRVTFDLGGNQYSLDNTVQLGIDSGDSANLTLKNGTFSGKTVGIGDQSNTTGSVMVDGATWNNTSVLQIGARGSGNLTIMNGSAVSSKTGIIGRGSESSGTVNLSGSGSTWNNTTTTGVGLDVGLYGSGVLQIESGASVQVMSSARIGGEVSGSVFVAGENSRFGTGAELYIGSGSGAGSGGELHISDGAQVETGTERHFGGRGAFIAAKDNQTGLVTVQTGGYWRNHYLLEIDYGQLDILNGGIVESDDTWIGPYFSFSGSGSNARVQVDGAGSRFSNRMLDVSGGSLIIDRGAQVNVNEEFTVGFLADASVQILNGGQLFTNSLAYLLYRPWDIGNPTDASVTVSGTASQWLHSDGYLAIGNNDYIEASSATLTVSDGATVMVTGDGSNTSPDDQVPKGNAFIASGIASTADVTVTGAGSTLSIEGTLEMGGFTSSDADREGGVATLYVSDSGAVSIGDTLKLRRSDSTVNLNGGTVNIGTGPAPTTVDTVRVGTGGSLIGNGIINGNVFNDGGYVAPGLSPGTLTIDGNYSQTALGQLVMEINGADPGEFDVLNVLGDLDLTQGLIALIISPDFMSDLLADVGMMPSLTDMFVVGGSRLIDTGIIMPYSEGYSSIEIEWDDQGNATTIRAPVPEPTTLALMGLGLAGIGYRRHRRKIAA